MQFNAGPQSPIALFDSAFDRVEDFLALAVLHGLEGKNDIRFPAVSVSRPDFATAQFVELATRFYSGVPAGSGFAAAFPVGLAAGKGPTPPPIAALLAKQGDDGAPVYKPAIKDYKETGDPATVLRNALSAAAPKGALIVVSGPLTTVAQMLALRGGKEMIALNVRHLAIAEPQSARDAKAAAFVFAEWPTPIFLCGEEAGNTVRYPGASIEKDFAWSKVHPIADAYRAFGAMPYDAPTVPLDTALYAARPSSPFFKLSDPGTLRLSAAGAVEFTAGAGKHHRVTVNPDKTADLVTVLTELASAKPVVRARRGPPNIDAAKAGKKK